MKSTWTETIFILLGSWGDIKQSLFHFSTCLWKHKHTESNTHACTSLIKQYYNMTYCGVFKIVEAVVRQDEPPSLPGFHSAPWKEKEEETGSETKAAVTDLLSPIRKKCRDVTLINDADPHPRASLWKFYKVLSYEYWLTSNSERWPF